MAEGKSHDLYNIFVGALVAGVMIGKDFMWQLVVAFIGGHLISTLIFSPDTDIMPKKRTGVLAFILFPYSIIFKHRGVSHHLIFGTLTRVIYTLLVIGFFIWAGNKMGYLSSTTDHYFLGIWYFVKSYNYHYLNYKILTWFFIGMIVADLTHIIVDKISSTINVLLSR